MMKKIFFIYLWTATLPNLLGAQQSTLCLNWQSPPLSFMSLYIYFKQYMLPTPWHEDIALFFKSAKSADHTEVFKLVDRYGKNIINQMLPLFLNNRLIAKQHILHLTFDYHWTDENNDFEKLLQCPGIDVNCKDFMGVTPLIHAVRNNDLKKARLLVTYGADMNITYIYGNALHEAACFNFIEMGKFLLDCGAITTPDFYKYAEGTELKEYAIQRIKNQQEKMLGQKESHTAEEHKSPGSNDGDYVIVNNDNLNIPSMQRMITEFILP